MSDFQCPKCNEEYTISDLELYAVYDEDGKETDFKCKECDCEMIITSVVTGWEFTAEDVED